MDYEPPYGSHGHVGSCNGGGQQAPYLAKDVDDLRRENSDMSPPAAELGWRPVLAKTVVSGVGFLSDAYDLYVCTKATLACACRVLCAHALCTRPCAVHDSASSTHARTCNDRFVINIVLLILSVTHGISAADKGWISSAVLVGALFGQIGFGLIADKVSYPPPTRSPFPSLPPPPPRLLLLERAEVLTVRAHHGSCADDDDDDA
jgi:hypothetical protein